MPEASRADGDVTLRLELEPLDVLFFRDARPFEAASRASSGLPSPQTLAGALRTTLLERHGIAPARLGDLVRQGAPFDEALATFGAAVGGIADVAVRGPWFRLRDRVLAPVPATLKREKKEIGPGKNAGGLVRLDPLASPPPGWRPPADAMLPLWRRGRTGIEPVDGYLTMEGLRRFLEGGLPEAADVVPPGDVYAFDDRTGIGIDETRKTAREGLIYGTRMLALRRDAILVGEAAGPAETLAPLAGEASLIRLGGEGRHARLRARPGGVDWPRVAAAAGAGRILVLTAPAWFDGWCPRGLRPAAAAVPGYEAVSGWDLARGGPKPNRFLVPAGAVYFLPVGEAAPAALAASDDAKVGWGDFVEGNWNHA